MGKTGSVNLKQALQGALPHEDITKLIRGYDVIGDVAVIIIPEELEHCQTVIGKTLLEAGPGVRVAAKRVGQYDGEYRTIELEKIAGEGELETLHKEFGVRLFVDPSKVYYSPRSGTERHRIAGLIQEGEYVLVLFSGIGPLPLMCSLHSPAEIIIGIEKNPEAHAYGVRNIKTNRRVKNVRLLCGDIVDLIPTLTGKFHRIAMPLPSGAAPYVKDACSVLLAGGWLHFYDFQKEGEFEQAVQTLELEVQKCGRTISEWSIHKCGHVSPSKFRICVDAQVY